MEGYPRKVLKYRTLLSRKRPECDTDAFTKSTDLITVRVYRVKSPTVTIQRKWLYHNWLGEKTIFCSWKAPVLFILIGTFFPLDRNIPGLKTIMKIGLNIFWAPLTTKTSRAWCHENLIKCHQFLTGNRAWSWRYLGVSPPLGVSLYAWEDPCTSWDLRVASLEFQDFSKQTVPAHWLAPAHLKSSTGEKNRLIIIWQGQTWVATQSSMGQGQ